MTHCILQQTRVRSGLCDRQRSGRMKKVLPGRQVEKCRTKSVHGDDSIQACLHKTVISLKEYLIRAKN